MSTTTPEILVVDLVREYISLLADIRTAPKELPAVVNTPDLPMALVLEQPGTWSRISTGFTGEKRDVCIRVFVKPVVTGLSIDEGYSASVKLLTTLGRYLLEDLSLGYRVNKTEGWHDTGVVAHSDPNNIKYWGFDFHMSVTLDTASESFLLNGIPNSGTPKPIDHANVSGLDTFSVNKPGT